MRRGHKGRLEAGPRGPRGHRPRQRRHRLATVELLLNESMWLGNSAAPTSFLRRPCQIRAKRVKPGGTLIAGTLRQTTSRPSHTTTHSHSGETRCSPTPSQQPNDCALADRDRRVRRRRDLLRSQRRRRSARNHAHARRRRHACRVVPAGADARSQRIPCDHVGLPRLRQLDVHLRRVRQRGGGRRHDRSSRCDGHTGCAPRRPVNGRLVGDGLHGRPSGAHALAHTVEHCRRALDDCAPRVLPRVEAPRRPRTSAPSSASARTRPSRPPSWNATPPAPSSTKS